MSILFPRRLLLSIQINFQTFSSKLCYQVPNVETSLKKSLSAIEEGPHSPAEVSLY